MYEHSLNLRNPSNMLERLLKPHSRRHKARASEATSWELSGAYADGGSRNDYTLVNHSGSRLPLPNHGGAPQFGGTSPTIDIKPGTVLIIGGSFCGEASHLHAIIHPDDSEGLTRS